MAETIYNSSYTGEQIDSAVAWLLKHAQDHICGGAVSGTTIAAPTDPTYWFAGAGTYTCGSSTITVPDGRIGIISYDGSSWSSETFDVGKSIVYLDSMGEELDGALVHIDPDMVIYDPVQSTIKKCTAPGVYETIGCNENLLYCNKITNILYRWHPRSANMIQVGAANISIVNDLSTGGSDKALSGEQGKELRYKIEEVYQRVKNMYSLFGNIAFWDGKPAIGTVLPDLDWSVPKQTVTLSLNLTHAVVKHNGTEKSNGSTIQAEQGSTLILTVEPASGYALTSVSSSTSGATVSDNGNGTYSVSIVVGSSNMTLSITASAEIMQHTITYNLTNCSATTKPTSVAQGGTATIVLQADSNYKMPSSLPSGAVTGASVTSYTVGANDNTKATLVIGNASDNVTITISAIDNRLEILFIKHMFYLISVQSGNEKFAMRTPNVSSGSYDKRRACLTVLRTGVDNPCAWNTSHLDTNGYDRDAMNTYSAIPIPAGTTKISIKCNAAYYHFPGLADANGNILDAAPQWFEGTTKKEYNLSDYPTATHFAVSFKIGNAGTTNFADETYESMGIELTFE